MDDQHLVECLDERSADTPHVDLEALGTLMARVLEHEHVPGGSQASLILVDPDRISDLKVEFLEGDGTPTDVLSFPIDGPLVASQTGHHGPLLIGDVVICPSVAAAQAPGHAGSFDDELALLVVHGSLHLLGWDHAEDEERRGMWAREKELMIELHGFPRRDPWGELDNGTNGESVSS